MKLIELTQGQVAIIDDEDFERLNKHKWFAMRNPKNEDFYAVRNIKKDGGGYKIILMHREIMNAPKGMMVDHIHHNTSDNRKSNLRICTSSQSVMNRRKYKRKCSSIYKGVWLNKRRDNKGLKHLQAGIAVNGKKIHLGFFYNEKDAARAYNKAALKYFGEFAELNIIQ